MIHIRLYEKAGSFAENKDIARDIRMREIIPALERNEEVILDFEKVDSVTQSFVHALISDLIRIHGTDILDRVSFKSCSDVVRKIITIVVDYMQESDN
jgi:hypothetical protein